MRRSRIRGQSSGIELEVPMNEESPAGRPSRRLMPRGAPRGVLAPAKPGERRSRLLCGRCRAPLLGIYDWGHPTHHSALDLRASPEVRLWKPVADIWAEVVWAVAPRVRRRAQRTGHLEPRRRPPAAGGGIDHPSSRPLTSSPSVLRLPAWVQCWRCEFVNLVEVAPRP